MLAMQEKEEQERQEGEPPRFTPEQAVKYLREKRGIIISVPGLRQRRKRGTATTGEVYKRTSLWTKEELDAIKPSPRTKLVSPEEEQREEP